MLTILFYGTGSYAFNWISTHADFLHFIEYKFIDKNRKKNSFFNIEVLVPEQISSVSYDYLCILSSFDEEIKSELINNYFIQKNKIITVYDLEEIIITQSGGKSFFNDDIIIRHEVQKNMNLSTFVNDYYDYQYLKQRYQNYIQNYSYTDSNYYNNQREKIIWICWFQGYENAPDIVKCCINSIKKYMPNNNIKIITEENMYTYITFPGYIIEKYKQGYITKTHLSDLLRLELLTTYGGIWMDATLLLTAPIPEKIQNSSLFLFNYNKEESMEPRNISSWFIIATQQNNILNLTKHLLYYYWKENEQLINYYLIHYFFRMATEKFSKEWDNNLHIVENSNLFQKYLFSTFNKEKYDYIKTISFCQKLSYKISIPKNVKETLYDFITKEYLKGGRQL